MLKSTRQFQTYYCRLDTSSGVKDYLDSEECIRFVGISQPEFNSLEQHSNTFEGLVTFTIDVDYVDFFENYEPSGRFNELTSDDSLLWSVSPEENLREMFQEDSTEKFEVWYQIITKETSSGRSYIYETFSEASPTFIKVVSVSAVNGPSFSSLPPFCANTKSTITYAQGEGSDRRGMYRFCAFHVGQGMCSLVHDYKTGFLLDAGAGKPITREIYLQGKIKNDLKNVTRKLKNLTLIVSHADSDHWRIIGWDCEILWKVENIYIPKGAMSLAFCDHAVYRKIIEIDENLDFKLTKRTSLSILRSKPAKSDSNGNCLVSLFKRGEKKALVPGDYAYQRFHTDHNRAIKELCRNHYSAVIVPHHGDKVSAYNIVRPAHSAIAFFSAGTHKMYKHPSGLSLFAHASAEYNLVVNNALQDIKVVPLL